MTLSTHQGKASTCCLWPPSRRYPTQEGPGASGHSPCPTAPGRTAVESRSPPGRAFAVFSHVPTVAGAPTKETGELGRVNRVMSCAGRVPVQDPYPGTGHEIVGNRPVEGSSTDRSRLLHGRPTRARPARTPLSLSVLIPWMGGWVAKRAAAPVARQAPGTRGANGRTRRNRSPSRSRSAGSSAVASSSSGESLIWAFVRST